MKRNTLIAIVMVAMLALAGCAGGVDDGTNDEASKQAEDISNSTGESVDGVQVGGSYRYEVKLTEKNQLQLVKSQPPFTMDHSLERENLIKRYQYLNDRNNVHHVYLIDEGQVMSYYVAQGKVSSVNSKLTNDVQIVRVEGCTYDTGHGAGSAGGAEGSCYKTVESPQMDGSYGTNGDAIFFFTTSGEYVQTNLEYVVSEEPKNIQSSVILTEQVGDDDEDDENEETANNSTSQVAAL